MGERKRRQYIAGEETGRCGCGRRGVDGEGVCIYCKEDFDDCVVDPQRKPSEVRDVTERYKK